MVAKFSIFHRIISGSEEASLLIYNKTQQFNLNNNFNI